jgi:hypothetical protein
MKLSVKREFEVTFSGAREVYIMMASNLLVGVIEILLNT